MEFIYVDFRFTRILVAGIWGLVYGVNRTTNTLSLCMMALHWPRFLLSTNSNMTSTETGLIVDEAWVGQLSSVN